MSSGRDARPSIRTKVDFVTKAGERVVSMPRCTAIVTPTPKNVRMQFDGITVKDRVFTAYLTPAEARRIAAQLIECADELTPEKAVSEPLPREVRDRIRLVDIMEWRDDIRRDRNGWFKLDHIEYHGCLPKERLMAAIEGDDRFELSRDGSMIRLKSDVPPLDPGPAIDPPAHLYLGLSTEGYLDIVRKGIIDPDCTGMVALRRRMSVAAKDAPAGARGVVLEIDARAMHDDGYEVHRDGSGVFRVESVPMGYVRRVGKEELKAPEDEPSESENAVGPDSSVSEE